MVVFFFKQKTAYEMRISDWSSDVCSSDLSPCQFFSDMRRIWNAPQAAFHRIEAGIDRHVHARQHVDEVRRTALRLAAIKPAHDLGHDVAIEEDRRILAHRGAHRRKPAADEDRTSTRLNSSH